VYPSSLQTDTSGWCMQASRKLSRN
jgi:hypothetical protein